MQSLQILSLCVMLATALCANCSRRYRTFRKLPGHDVVDVQDALAVVMAPSALDCGRQCTESECLMFTFLPHQDAPSGDCQLYGRLPNSTAGQHQGFPDARSYAVLDPCEDGYSLVCGRCLTLLESQQSYQDGQEQCRQLSQGRYMLLKAQEDLQCAARFLDMNKAKWGAWVGADDLKKEGVFVWSDGTALDTNSQLWAPDQPDNANGNEHCVLLTPWSLSLKDTGCDKKRLVLCEKDLHT